ncbi:4-hydroxythreonine-4-phosphate dehydrogenase PdxA [Erythrobacter arachoides]|uniref:4-hydroxythreonine-4-phosphate dehydrogenase n=1 Tax=Aurantiacibacter arachoides TaxID=1850444 RepID=A0A845A416_9SPHN|nr:4-hydroxythreonine-4-phosphate dehydrogenase PdxA [Aurantiacibacter arachoides]MXO93657.1 4-hydroxythreonine-4-phosphate dehydrogenase PdxA [Aurantiacibacter arachoides]GGD47707.1 4-hydroxythreonine-4-phosphate dehydrogenase [Aurantiacibacter arachoides]
MTHPAPLAVTIGDPAGIGPEIIAEVEARREALALPAFVVVGNVGAARAGEPDRTSAAIALDALQRGVALVLNGECSGIVTGPVAKSGIAAIDPAFVGQTEFLADACGLSREDAVMMLAGPSLRTVPMTVHCALADVPSRLSQDLIVRRVRIVARALQTDFGIAAPRVAVAGLNPHAGENGRMGREEIEIIAPAIAQLRAEGIDATGPHPADTLYAPHKRGTYDVAVAMYHDQALVPLKALDFDEGVNVTLGLPIVRTSPDHGTAFDIAGQGVARADAMIAAIRMAADMVTRRSMA